MLPSTLRPSSTYVRAISGVCGARGACGPACAEHVRLPGNAASSANDLTGFAWGRGDLNDRSTTARQSVLVSVLQLVPLAL